MKNTSMAMPRSPLSAALTVFLATPLAVLMVFSSAIVVTACAGGGNAQRPVVKSPGDGTADARGQGQAEVEDDGAAQNPDDAGTRDRAGGGDAVADVSAGRPCPEPSCVYHAGTDAYFVCLNGAAGRCFHYGRPCTPGDSCMFDADSGRYRQCRSAQNGRCLAFADTCRPPGFCVFNPADGLHHTCEEAAADGRCRVFGEICGPP